MDLDAFATLVDERRSGWEQHGLKVEYRRSLEHGSASVRCKAEKKIAELQVWTSGAADLGTARLDVPNTDPAWHLYGIISETNLPDCLDDLTDYLLTED